MGEQEAIDILFVRFVMVASCVGKGAQCSWIVRGPGRRCSALCGKVMARLNCLIDLSARNSLGMLLLQSEEIKGLPKHIQP